MPVKDSSQRLTLLSEVTLLTVFHDITFTHSCFSVLSVDVVFSLHLSRTHLRPKISSRRRCR